MVTVIFGICTLGLVHVFCAIAEYCIKPTNKENPTEQKTDEFVRGKLEGEAKELSDSQNTQRKSPEKKDPQTGPQTTSTLPPEKAKPSRVDQTRPKATIPDKVEPAEKNPINLSPFLQGISKNTQNSLFYLFGNTSEVLNQAPETPMVTDVYNDQYVNDIRVKQNKIPVSTTMKSGRAIYVTVRCEDPEEYLNTYEKAWLQNRSHMNPAAFQKQKDAKIEQIKEQVHFIQFSLVQDSLKRSSFSWRESSGGTHGSPDFFNSQAVIDANGEIPEESKDYAASFKNFLSEGQGVDSQGVSWKVMFHEKIEGQVEKPIKTTQKAHEFGPFLENLPQKTADGLCYLFGNTSAIINQAPDCPQGYNSGYGKYYRDIPEVRKFPVTKARTVKPAPYIVVSVVCADPEAHFNKYHKENTIRISTDSNTSSLNQDWFDNTKKFWIESIQRKTYLIEIKPLAWDAKKDSGSFSIWSEENGDEDDKEPGNPNFFNGEVVFDDKGEIPKICKGYAASFQKLFLEGQSIDSQGIPWKISHYEKIEAVIKKDRL